MEMEVEGEEVKGMMITKQQERVSLYHDGMMMMSKPEKYRCLYYGVQKLLIALPDVAPHVPCHSANCSFLEDKHAVTCSME
jgi:hypothetical protein